MKHNPFMHIIGCALPLLLIFILPSLGVSENALFFIFIILMFFCHLGMMGGHHHGGDDQDENSDGHEHEEEGKHKGHHGCH
jgi:hypothetical protein